MCEITWTTVKQSELPESDAWLGPHELALLSQLRAGPRRDSFRLGRYAAKRLLGELEVLNDRDGVPCAYRAGVALPISLSLSHRAGVALAAAVPGTAAVGCDIERVEPRSQAFLHDFLTPAERAAVAAASDRAACANLIWSAKESALKALHVGLRRDTWELEVALAAAHERGPRVRPRRAHADDDARDGWHDLRVTDLRDGRTYPGACLHAQDYVITVVCAQGTPPDRSLEL